MRTVIIYNNHRPEKYDLFVAELKRQGIDNYEIYHCDKIQNKPIVECISESFKSVIREAKERGESEICIMEDDIMFPSEHGWEYFIKNKPDNYDIYIGGSYLIDNRLEFKPPLVKVDSYVGNQILIVHERYFDTWLNTNEKEHCDTVHRNGLFYLCFPFIGLQRSGWSCNSQAVVNYNPVIPENFILP